MLAETNKDFFIFDKNNLLMITPTYLKKGNTIGIIAPAKWISQDKYPTIIQFIEEKGYKVIRGKSTFAEHGPFAGNDELRLTDMQSMIDNAEVDAIFCLRGGYGTIRIIEELNFEGVKTHPKWIVGFSDITILHNTLSNLGIESIHGQMPINFDNEKESTHKLFEVLEGKSISYNFDSNTLNRTGNANGILTGGNIAILCSMLGTTLDTDWTNKILFIEEVGEYLYKLDRMMHQLKLSGKLNNLAGLIVGGLSSMEDNTPKFGQTAQEIIFNVVKEYDFPVCFDFPAGHIPNNQPMIMGREVHLIIDRKFANLMFNSHE